MTAQTYVKGHPCLACGENRYYKDVKKCINCTKKSNALKAAKTMKNMPHDWNTQYIPEQTASEKFLAKERKIMAGVRYE